MIYIVIGAVGVVIVHLCDPVAIRRLPLLKPLVWTVGVALVLYATIMACFWPEKLALPVWSTWTGWILLVVSLVLLAFSLFFNLPFRKTYVTPGVGDRLITSGLYALVRHPGVSWTVLGLGAVILVSKSRLILVASPMFIVLDILAVAIQDRLFFPRMFAGYDEYRRKTPMLIPTRKSLSAFACSFRQSGPNRLCGSAQNPKEATNVHTS